MSMSGTNKGYIYPSMSRGHFVFIAETISSLRQSGLSDKQAKIVAETFANRLGYTNAAFKSVKFIDACLNPSTTTK